MANSGGASELGSARWASPAPGCRVICGPGRRLGGRRLGQVHRLLARRRPVVIVVAQPEHRAAARAAPLTSSPTTTPTPTSATRPEMIGWPSSSLKAGSFREGPGGSTTSPLSVRIPDATQTCRFPGEARRPVASGHAPGPDGHGAARCRRSWRQAGAWVTQYKGDLAARGLGFTPTTWRRSPRRPPRTRCRRAGTSRRAPPTRPRCSVSSRRRSRPSTRSTGSRRRTRGSRRWACRSWRTPSRPGRSAGPTRTTALVERVLKALGHTREDYDPGRRPLDADAHDRTWRSRRSTASCSRTSAEPAASGA